MTQLNKLMLIPNLFDPNLSKQIHYNDFSDSSTMNQYKRWFAARGTYADAPRDAFTQWMNGASKDWYAEYTTNVYIANNQLTLAAKPLAQAEINSGVSYGREWSCATLQSHGFNYDGSWVGGEIEQYFGVWRFRIKTADPYEGQWASAFLKSMEQDVNKESWVIEVNPLEHIINSSRPELNATQYTYRCNGNFLPAHPWVGKGAKDRFWMTDNVVESPSALHTEFNDYAVALAPWQNGTILLQYAFNGKIVRSEILPYLNHNKLHFVLKLGAGNNADWAGVANQNESRKYMRVSEVEVRKFVTVADLKDAVPYLEVA